VDSSLGNNKKYGNLTLKYTTTSAKLYIHLACHHPHAQLRNHPDIPKLLLPLNINIPPLPTNDTEHTKWIENLAAIGKKAKVDAYKITTKQAMSNIKTAIKKYRTLLNTKPKAIHKKIFQPTTENSLDCI
jgi:hypothetical protein